LPVSEQRVLRELLDGYAAEGIEYHALRTRRAGAHRSCRCDVLVPGTGSVQQGHDLLERIESDVRRAAAAGHRPHSPRAVWAIRRP